MFICTAVDIIILVETLLFERGLSSVYVLLASLHRFCCPISLLTKFALGWLVVVVVHHICVLLCSVNLLICKVVTQYNLLFICHFHIGRETLILSIKLIYRSTTVIVSRPN